MPIVDPFDPQPTKSRIVDPLDAPAKPAAPAKQGPKWYEGVPTQPLAGGKMGLTDLVAGGRPQYDAAGRLVSYADQLYRTFAGAAADTADAVSGLVNRPINSVLSAVGSDFQLPVDQVGPKVPQPVGVGGQIARAFTPFIIAPAATEAKLVDAASDIARAPQAARVAAETPRLAERVGRGVVSGAPLDAGMAPKQDTNVSNLVQTATGVPIPTARSATDTPAVSAIKDVVEGAVLSGAVDAAAHFFLRGARAAPGTPQAALEEEQVLQAVQDPNVRAQLEASGITPESTPRYAEFVAKAEARQAEQAARAADPFANAEPPAFKPTPRPEGAPPPTPAQVAGARVDQTLDYRGAQRAAAADLEARTQLPPEDPARVDPGALPRAGVEPPAPEVPLRVTQDGQAFVPDDGALRGQELRKPSNLPVVVEPQPRAMSDVEVAQARRLAGAGNVNRAASPDVGPDAQLRGGEAPPERSVTYAPDRPQRALPAPEPMRVTPEGQAFDPRGDVPGAAQSRAPEPDIKPDVAPAAEAPRAEAPPAPKPSSTVAAAPVEGRFAVDESGQVVSNKGGPVRFATEAQAQKWAQNVGAKKAPGQAFEIAPAEKGFTVKEKAAPPAEEPQLTAPPDQTPKTRPETGADVGQRQPLPNTPETQTAPGSTPEAVNSSRVEQSDSGYMAPSKASGPVEPQRAPEQGPETGRESDVGQQQSSPSARRAAAEAAEPVPDRETPAENAREARTGEPSQDAPTRRAQAETAEAVPDRGTKAENAQEARTGEPSDGELTDAQLQRIHERMKQKPTKLYSNPLDPEALDEHLVQPLKETLRKELAAAKKDKEWLGRAFGDTDRRPAAIAREAYDFSRRIAREAGMSGVAALHSFAKQYPDVPEIKALADALGTDPGSGRAVAEPFEMGAMRVANTAYNRAANIMEDWRAAGATPEQIRRAMTGQARTAADRQYGARLRRILDDHLAYLRASGLDVGEAKDFFPRNPDPLKVERKQAEFMRAAQELYRREGSADPKAAAKAWFDEITTGGTLHVQRIGATLTTKSTRERTFKTPDADKLLAPFMQDPGATLADYFARTSRYAEFARRFGADGTKLEDMFKGMLDKGVTPKDLASIRFIADSAAGLLPGTKPNAFSTAANWVHTVYTMRLLGRAVTASLSEPFVVAIRTGDSLLGAKALGSYLTAPFDKAGRQEWRERAELLGVISDAATDALLMNRAGTDALSKGQQVALNRFFRTMQISPITEFQQATMTRLADWHLRATLAREGGDAGRMLRDLYGLDDAAAGRLRKWVARNGDNPPPVTDLLGKSQEGEDYAKAIYRMVNETIQNPIRANKPAIANDPRFKAIYGITTFMFSFTRNVTMKMVKDLGGNLASRELTLPEKAQAVLGPSFAYGLYAYMGYQVWNARDKLLNPESSKERSKGERFYTGVSQAGVFGNAQPLIDLSMSAFGRYNRDLTSAYAGPQYTTFLQDLANLAKGIQGGSDKTNNAEWQGVRAGYNMAVVNPILVGTQFIPTGPLGRVGIFALDTALAAPGTSRAVADAVAGERKVKPKAKNDDWLSQILDGQQSSTSDDSSGYGGADDMGMSMELKLED